MAISPAHMAGDINKLHAESRMVEDTRQPPHQQIINNTVSDGALPVCITVALAALSALGLQNICTLA